MEKRKNQNNRGDRVKVYYNSGRNFLEVLVHEGIEVIDYNPYPVKPVSVVENAFKELFPLVKGKNSVAIIVDDHTRPTPIKDILPYLFNVLEVARVKERRIIVAFGTHNHPEEEYLVEKLGSDVINNEIVILHDAFDKKLNVYAGTTSLGNMVYLNKWAVNADFKMGIGSVFSSEIAGFTGGPKIVLPGIAADETIEYNHAYFSHKDIKAGFYEGNPIPRDMAEAARLLPIDWILDLVMTPDGIIDIFYGDFEEFHPKARALVREIYTVKVKKTRRLLIGCGMTEDVDFVQTVKAMFVANEFCELGGEIFLVAWCPLGLNWEELVDTVHGGKVEEFALAVYRRLKPLFTGDKRVYMFTNGENFPWVKEIGFEPVSKLNSNFLSDGGVVLPNGALMILQ